MLSGHLERLAAGLSTIGVVAAAPIFAWEVSLALWMIMKGFRPSPVLTGVTQAVAPGHGSCGCLTTGPSGLGYD